MKKLLILALALSSSSHVFSATEELPKNNPWDPDAVAKRKAESATLQRRDSYQNLERLRNGLDRHDGKLRKVEHKQYEDRAPFHDEHRETEEGKDDFFRYNTDMRDIKKPGDASLATINIQERLLDGKRQKLFSEATRDKEKRAKLERRASFKTLESLRRDRGDFEVDEFGKDRVSPEGEKFVRMSDVEKAGDSSALLKEELRLADKYITHLRSENEKLKAENEKKDNKIRNLRKKLKILQTNAPETEKERSSSVETESAPVEEERTYSRFPGLKGSVNNDVRDRGFELMQKAAERGRKIRQFDESTTPKGEARGFDRVEMRKKTHIDPTDDVSTPSSNEGGEKATAATKLGR